MNNEQTNPFDDERQAFLILVNARTQYSLWPEFASVPQGWRVVLGPENRGCCMEWLEQHWQDIRPEPLHAAGVAGQAPSSPGGRLPAPQLRD